MATFAINNFQGTRTTAAVPISDAAVSGSITITSTDLTNTLVAISISIDFSPDGGVTWAATSPGPQMNPFPVIATFNGGATDKHGTPQTTFGLAAPFPAGTNRQVRGTFIVDGAPITGTLTATEQ